MADNRGAGDPIPLEGKGLNCNMNSMLTASSQHLLRSCFGVGGYGLLAGRVFVTFCPCNKYPRKTKKERFLDHREISVRAWLAHRF